MKDGAYAYDLNECLISIQIIETKTGFLINVKNEYTAMLFISLNHAWAKLVSDHPTFKIQNRSCLK